MMKIRILVVLCSGLCWVACDKPEVGADHEEKSALTKSVSRDKRVPMASPLEGTVGFRELVESADRIDCPLLREKALADIAWNAIEMDPEVAHEAFRRLPVDSLERIRLIQHDAMRLAKEDPEAAVLWAHSFETERETAAAMAHVALELAESDPHRAAVMLSESGIEGREFDVVLVQVIQRWAAQSAPAAAAWVSSFAPGEARAAGIKAIVERWLPQDPSGAFGWLGRVTPGDFRDEAARAMQGVLLQQPKVTRENWLQDAAANIRSELDQQNAPALSDVGNNIPLQLE